MSDEEEEDSPSDYSFDESGHIDKLLTEDGDTFGRVP